MYTKKVGVVAEYRRHNCGTMLQAFATQRILDEYKIDNEIIKIEGFSKEIQNKRLVFFVKAIVTSDYFKQKYGMLLFALRKKLIKDKLFNSIKKRDAKFDEFYNKNFIFSEKYKTIKKLSECSKNKYHSIIVGSDQLWLPSNIAGDFFTLSWVPESVNRISYATSFGQEALPNSMKAKAADFLSKINHISVRELSGQNLVQVLTGRVPPIVCDPTILINKEYWDLMRKDCEISGKYIFCYFLGKEKKCRDFAKKLKEKTGCKIVCSPHLETIVQADKDFADYDLFEMGPGEFLHLISNAEYVCTDSFHASVFSVLYEKKFFAMPRYEKNTKLSTNSRITQFLNYIGASNCYIKDYEFGRVNNLDYKKINERLENLRSYSQDYLFKALMNKENTDI